MLLTEGDGAVEEVGCGGELDVGEDAVEVDALNTNCLVFGAERRLLGRSLVGREVSVGVIDHIFQHSEHAVYAGEVHGEGVVGSVGRGVGLRRSLIGGGGRLTGSK